ncbi:hypothetical protein CDL12_14490 [Handroanthus impetiginosus]|uniref:WRKY domain-containing protein n=1 Tax=Handroanthus impetiginosus TaxID=429701 RepID=A0A2G9H5V3_9LAMI|nr:hypothetical protein CDL12_14490 [Handroanthus impetiginosus]
MAAIDGGGGRPPFMTNANLTEEEHQLFQNDNRKPISIAERRAAKSGFNASNINAARFKTTTTSWMPQVGLGLGSSCFTIPPGISPSALLDSPVMLPNAQAQQSPTTGTFEFPSPCHDDSLKLKLKHATKPEAQGQGVAHLENKVLIITSPANHIYDHIEQPFEGLEYLQEMSKRDSYFEVDALAKSEDLVQCSTSLQPSITNNNNNSNSNQILSHNEHISGRERLISTNSNHQRSKEVAKYSDDGFYWRKYGQKHVKGSEFPRSYYKCTATNCPVKKKVERSHDGQITEIVYKGSHNHPVPDQAFKGFSENAEISEGRPSCFQTNGKAFALSSGWRADHCLDGTISTSFLSDFSDHPISRPINTYERVEAQFSSPVGRQDCDGRNEASPQSISLNDEDDENGESCEPKKRKRDSFPIETIASRSTREPRVVVQIESKIDILDDGYRWRKYGQKVVKGNPNPRSYYKCTTPGCPVRKHVERAANDIKSVVTTYEGKHNHEVPTSKNSSLVISDVGSLPPAVTNSTLSTRTTMAQQLDVPTPRTGKQVQDLPLYLDRKPMFSFNDMMRSNLPGNFANDVKFGASSVYPLSFPPFQSLPPYGSRSMSNSHIKNYPSCNLYPMLPDYMPLSSQINHVPGSGSANVSPTLGGNFHFNTYSVIQTGSSHGREMEIRQHHPKTVKPKEEQRDDGHELYDNCLSIPIHGNGTI